MDHVRMKLAGLSDIGMPTLPSSEIASSRAVLARFCNEKATEAQKMAVRGRVFQQMYTAITVKR